MDQKKQRILNQLEAIREDGNSVIENMKLIIHQISSYVESSADLKGKIYSDIFCYELDVLKEFDAVKLQLEALLESNPVSNAVVDHSKSMLISEHVINLPSSSREPDISEDVCNIENKTIAPQDGQQCDNLNCSKLTVVQNPLDLESSNNDSKILSTIECNTNLEGQEASVRSLASKKLNHSNTMNTVSIEDQKKPKTTKDQTATKLAVQEKEKTIVQYSAFEKLPSLSNTVQCDIKKFIKLQPIRKVKCNARPQTTKNSIDYALKEKIPPKAGDVCAFCHIENPAEFYIRIFDDQSNSIDSMTDKLNRKYNNKTTNYKTKLSAYNDIEKFCVAYIKWYNGWCRAEVIDWHINDSHKKVDIFLIDYGNKRAISYKYLKKMDTKLYSIPKLAIRCHLPLMYPPGSSEMDKKTTWPVESIDGFLSTAKQDGRFKIVYACYDADSESVAIDMFNINEGNGGTIGQMLLDLELAVQVIPPECGSK